MLKQKFTFHLFRAVTILDKIGSKKKEAFIDLKAESDSVTMNTIDVTLLVKGLRKMAMKNSIFSNSNKN